MKRSFFEVTGYRGRSDDEMRGDAQAYLDKMRERRSVRQFARGSVPIDILETCVKAAGTAPSGAHQQPWHFVIVTDDDMKTKIRAGAEAEERAFYQHRAPEPWLKALSKFGTDANKPFLEDAAALIVIFAETHNRTEDGVTKRYYARESVGIATGMLISAVHHAGLACLTYTPSPMSELRKLLGRPSSETPFLVLVVGRPHPEATVPELSRKSLREIASTI